jgi:hypothetical protein
MQQDNYSILLGKIDEFTRKYYKNLLIRGGIYAFAVALAFFLVVAGLEYIGNFDTTVRTALFYSFLAVNGIIGWKLVLTPLFKLYRLGKVISHEEAAKIIGTHFTGIRDKLLNTLQLRNLSYTEGVSSELIQAGINQKIEELKPVPFSSAINLKDNRRYIKYAAIPLLILITTLFAAPNIIRDPAVRIMDHRTYFEKQAPFSFNILNSKLQAVQQDDYRLELKMDGNEIPDNVMIEVDGVQYQMDKESILKFNYTFKNLQKTSVFRFFADGFYSKEHELEVLPSPAVVKFDVALEFPAYLAKPAEQISNTGDLVIPAGTRVKWKFFTRNTEALKIAFNDSAYDVQRKGDDEYDLSMRFLKNTSYSITASNKLLKSRDTIRYSLTVIPDQHPTITAEQHADSMSTKRYFFKGMIRDDYGFSRMTFNYRFIGTSGDSTAKVPGAYKSESIPVSRNVTQEQYFFMKDFSDIHVAAGDQVEYYFEIWDNDGVTGNKSARSPLFVFKAPTMKELEQSAQKQSDEIKNELKAAIKESKQLQKEFAELNKRLLEKKSVDWQDKKKLEDLVNRQKELEKKIGSIRTENQQKLAQQADYKELNKDLLEKQQQLSELMEKIMTDEMKKLMEELQKMVDNMDKQKLQESLEKMKLSNKDIEKELDRNLEIFKQLEFEQKMNEVVDNLDEFSKKEEQLSKESMNKNADNKELQKKQEELAQNFEDIKKDLQDLEKKNENLENKQDFQNPEKEQGDIEKDMKESQQQLSQNKNKKASDLQKSASEKAKALSQKLSEMQAMAQQEQKEEDVNSLRALLENLVRLSFSQEKLMNDLKTMDVNNPRYLSMAQQQRKLKDDAAMMEDSLFALSKRIIEIQSVVTREVNSINQNMDKSMGLLEERNIAGSRSRQQYVMTSVNNLSLLLNEVMDAMQEQLNKMSGMGSCSKPGSKKGSSPSMAKLRQMQEKLNQQLKEMKEGKKPGGKSGSQGMGMSEQLARMAAQQQAIRNELQKLNQQMNKDGKATLGDLDKMAKEMEKTETDIVNRMISEETLNRQQEILTRMLESEKAEKERDEDQKRESRESKNIANRNPKEFEEYKRLKQKEMELLKTVPPALRPFYKQKINEYFQEIGND